MFINPVAAGPNVDPYTYVHSTWVRWPMAVDAEGLNRPLMALTGLNWDLNSGWWSVRDSLNGSGLRLTNSARLARTGFFDQRREHLRGRNIRVLSLKSGAVSRTLLPLAFDGVEPSMFPVRLGDSLHGNELVVAEVTNWNDVAAIGTWIKGRVLAVEYPTQRGKDWSRVWLMGKGWPQSGSPHARGMPTGFLGAQDLAGLVFGALDAGFVRDDTLEWGGSNRWFDWNAGAGRWLLLVIGVLFSVAIVASAVLVSTEKRSVAVEVGWLVLFLVPAGLVLGGWITRLFGLPGWWIYHLIGLTVMFGLADGVQRWIRRKHLNSHDWAGAALVGLVVVAVVPSEWSILGAAFRPWTVGMASEQLGAIFFYGGLSVFFTARLDGLVWFLPRVFLTAMAIFGVVFSLPWSSDSGVGSALLVVGWLVGDGYLRPANLVILTFLPRPLIHMINAGFGWSHLGAVRYGWQAQGIDLFSLLAYQSLPFGVWATVWSVGVLLFSGNFMTYHLSRVWGRSALGPVLGLLVLAPLAIMILSPALVGAVGMCVWLGVVVVGFESVRGI